MKYVFQFLLLLSSSAMACGPSPQKVVEAVVIHSTPEAVWSVLRHPETMQQWHPAVTNATVEHKRDSAGKETVFQIVQLKNGSKLVERMRETQAGEMKLGMVMVQGDMAVSNYSDVLTVKQGSRSGETVITWAGRFNNKANLLVAPEGQDNKTAISAVEQFYQQGLQGLKAYMESFDK